MSALDFCMLTVWLCMELAIAKLLRNSRICVDCALAIIAFACVKPAEEIPGPSHFLVCKIYFLLQKTLSQSKDGNIFALQQSATLYTHVNRGKATR